MEVIHKKRIGEIHFQHTVWLNQLIFYTEELKIFQGRLEEIASKNTREEVRTLIEQFQNRFIIQKNEIDKLKHKINVIEDEATKMGKIHIRRVDYETTEHYIDISNEVNQFEKLYKELKNDFYQFLCKWM